MKITVEPVKYSKNQLPQVELNDPYLAIGVNMKGDNWIGEGATVDEALNSLYSIADTLVGEPIVIRISAS